jgi:hypothetical protein
MPWLDVRDPEVSALLHRASLDTRWEGPVEGCDTNLSRDTAGPWVTHRFVREAARRCGHTDDDVRKLIQTVRVLWRCPKAVESDERTRPEKRAFRA